MEIDAWHVSLSIGNSQKMQLKHTDWMSEAQLLKWIIDMKQHKQHVDIDFDIR